MSGRWSIRIALALGRLGLVHRGVKALLGVRSVLHSVLHWIKCHKPKDGPVVVSRCRGLIGHGREIRWKGPCRTTQRVHRQGIPVAVNRLIANAVLLGEHDGVRSAIRYSVWKSGCPVKALVNICRR